MTQTNLLDIINIINLPKDIQRYILEFIPYPYIVQKKELLEDIRDFTESYHILVNQKQHYDVVIEFEDITQYSQEDVEYFKNYTIYYNLLFELDHPNITVLGERSSYYYKVLSRLYMFNKNWFLKYQYDTDDIDYYKPELIKKIRFIFGIMTVEERFDFIYYYYYNEDEEEDYDW